MIERTIHLWKTLEFNDDEADIVEEAMNEEIEIALDSLDGLGDWTAEARVR